MSEVHLIHQYMDAGFLSGLLYHSPGLAGETMQRLKVNTTNCPAIMRSHASLSARFGVIGIDINSDDRNETGKCPTPLSYCMVSR
jgi:hypothetical protein